VTVSREVEAEIARLFHAEHWRVGTIATQLGVHPDVVRRVIRGQDKKPRADPAPPSAVAPYVDFIRETLSRYPKLCSTRLGDMLRERGFAGSTRSLRRFVKQVRPKGEREAFLRLDTLIGEEAQIDWAYVGQLPVEGDGRRSLWLFLMVLSWSRAAWGEFCFDTTVHSLLRSLVRGASYFGGTGSVGINVYGVGFSLRKEGTACRRTNGLIVKPTRMWRSEARERRKRVFLRNFSINS
jgi:transposase